MAYLVVFGCLIPQADVQACEGLWSQLLSCVMACVGRRNSDANKAYLQHTGLRGNVTQVPVIRSSIFCVASSSLPLCSSSSTCRTRADPRSGDDSKC